MVYSYFPVYLLGSFWIEGLRIVCLMIFIYEVCSCWCSIIRVTALSTLNEYKRYHNINFLSTLKISFFVLCRPSNSRNYFSFWPLFQISSTTSDALVRVSQHPDTRHLECLTAKHVLNFIMLLISQLNCNAHRFTQDFPRIENNLMWHLSQIPAILQSVWKMKPVSNNKPRPSPSKSLIIHSSHCIVFYNQQVKRRSKTGNQPNERVPMDETNT
jgi:hypothetical protein